MDSSAFSQQLNYTLSRDFLWGFDNYYNSKEQNTQTFVKPYRFSQINQITDSTAAFPRLLAGTKAEEHDKTHKNLVEIFPLMAAEVGYESGSSSRLTHNLAIGGNLIVSLGDKFALNFKALAGKATYSSYMDSIIKQTHMIPGIGYAYLSKKDPTNPQYAYQYFSGYASYSPNKIFNFQVGQDKHFWGDGYRSLFLSDVAAPYPFLKITTNVWHLTYVNLYTIMRDATNPSGLKKDWLNKYATFHYLGWNATKRINIGLFESIVWQGTDSTRYRGYDVNYLNPVMFFRPTEYSLGSSDNAFLGLSLKIKMFKKQQFYGQLLLDEFLLKDVVADLKHTLGSTNTNWGWWGNKQAFQIGFKSFDLFKIKKLNFQTEFNYVRPYTYSHASVQQNYGQMNQPLADPLGANFVESATFINYRYKRLFVEGKCTYAIYGGDSSTTDYGKNIFISYVNRPNEYGNFIGQGFQTRLITASLRGAYVLDTHMNLKIELGFADRIITSTYSTKQTPYIFFGIKTDLSNLYDDF
ncbi:MAG: hypothetical protein ACXVPU_01970 [Bacteroidia bacterium]